MNTTLLNSSKAKGPENLQAKKLEAERMQETLFNKHGGLALMQKLVEQFHARIVADTELVFLARRLDWQLLVRHEVAVCSALLDGPRRLCTQELTRCFKRYGLGARHLERLSEHLMQALAAVGLNAEACDELHQRLQRLREDLRQSEHRDHDALPGRLAAGRQQRLIELAEALSEASTRLEAHPDICALIAELRQVAHEPQAEHPAESCPVSQT